MSDKYEMTLPTVGQVVLRQPTGYGTMILMKALQAQSLSETFGDLLPLADIEVEANPTQAGLQIAQVLGKRIESLLPIVEDVPGAIVIAFCAPQDEGVPEDPDHGGIDFKWARANVSVVDAAAVLKAALETGIVTDLIVAIKNIWPSMVKLVR